MGRFLQYAFAGLSAGSLYALVALGLVLIYRSTRVLNFAHGDVATFGTFVAFAAIGSGMPLIVALPVALAAGAVIAVVFYFGAVVPAQRKGASPLGTVILTSGLALILQGITVWHFGAEPTSFPFPLSDTKVWQVGPIYVSQLSVGTLLAAAATSLVLYLLTQQTRLGLAMRATSENLAAAQTLGIPTRRVLAFSWGVAAGLAVIAGIFLAPALLLDPFFMLDPLFKGLAAAVLGGLNSLPGAVVGALILGVVESLAGAYGALEFKSSLAFVLIVVVLLVRPEGLLGREFQERV
jgi:branched-chain amino acid transport system permease protein